MQDQSDAQLLRAYAKSRQETAFREIVTRHTDLVYCAALRQVSSPELARDLAQGVFTDLARKARPLAQKLAEGSSLVGWLYRSTRFAALKYLRDNRRRLTHERQAMEQLIINSDTAPDWESVRPVLDETMADLNDADREAVLLRYFENCDFQTVGRALGVSDAAAQKRVSRALEKLRELLSRRGITITGGTLSLAIAANAVQAAPAGLAATLFTTAIAGTSLTAASVAATKAITMTTLQKTIVGAAIAAAVGTGIYEAREAARQRSQLQALQRQHADQVQQLQGERDDATNRLANAFAEISRLQSNSNQAELLKLRGEVGRSKNRTDADEQRVAGQLTADLARLKNYFETNPKAKTPELQFLMKEDWVTTAASSVINTYGIDRDKAYRHAAAQLRGTADRIVGGMFRDALAKYKENNNGQFPTDLNQIKPYLQRSKGRPDSDAPIQDVDAILDRWQIVPANQVKGLVAGGDLVVTQKAPVDDLFDLRVVVGNGWLSRSFLETDSWDTLQPVRTAYRAAHGSLPSDDSLLEPYAITPDQQAALQKILQSARWSDPVIPGN